MVISLLKTEADKSKGQFFFGDFHVPKIRMQAFSTVYDL